MTNFGSDIKDSENYAVLLNRLAPPDLVELAALKKEPDLLARAHSVLEAAAKIGCKKYVSPRDIIEVTKQTKEKRKRKRMVLMLFLGQ